MSKVGQAIRNGIKAAVVAVGVVLIASFLAPTVVFSAMWATAAALAGAGAFVSTLLSKPISTTVENFGSKVSGFGAINPRQIVYGQTRVGGTIVHARTTGTENSKLHLIIAIAGHEIEEISKIYINKVELTTSTSTINSTTVYTVTNSDFTNTDNDNSHGSGRLIRYVQGLGADNQEMNGYTIAQNIGFTADHDLKGVAYVHFNMVYDQEKLVSLPEISFLVKGKKVYDPRTTNTVWSDNPALIARDYLTDTRYGLRATSDEIDDTAITSAANACEVQVLNNASPQANENKYTANGFINATTSGADAMSGILSSCAGKVIYSNGKFIIKVGVTETPDFTITDDDLIAPLQLSNTTELANIFNTVKTVYVDKDTDYVPKDGALRSIGRNSAGTSTNFLTIDTPTGEQSSNYRKIMEMQLPFVTKDSQAQRLSELALNYQRRTKVITASVNLRCLQVQTGDWVYVTNERLGFTNKVFEVLTATTDVAQDETPYLFYKLALKEIDNSVFTFDTSSDYIAGTEGTFTPPSEITLGAPTSLAGTSSVSINADGTSVGTINLTWNNASDATISSTEIQWKKGSTFGTEDDSKIVNYPAATAQITGLEVGATYYIRARHKGPTNILSNFTSVISVSVTADNTAPSTPTNLDATDDVEGSIFLSWTNPSDSDFRATKVYRRTVNTTPTDDTYLVDTVSGQPNKISTTGQGLSNGLSPNTTYYFWVKAVDHSGNESSISAVETGLFFPFSEDIIGGRGGNIFTYSSSSSTNAPTDSQFNTSFGKQPKDNDIVIVTNTSTTPDSQKIYQYSGMTANSTGGGGTFTEKTNSDFISGDLIIQNSIVTNNIAANAITATEINVANLSAIASNLGAIDAGSLNINSGQFVVTSAGAMTAQSANVTGTITSSAGTIGGFTLGSTSLTAGSGSTRVSLSTADGIHLGNNTFSSAPFRVTRAGALTATNATITGNITASTLNVSGATVTGTLDASTITLNGTPLDDIFAFSGGTTTITGDEDISGDLSVTGNIQGGSFSLLANGGMSIASGAPATTTNKLYQISSGLYWNGNLVSSVTGIANFADNRVLTASSSSAINGEANLTFNGSTLTVTGDVATSGHHNQLVFSTDGKGLKFGDSSILYEWTATSAGTEDCWFGHSNASALIGLNSSKPAFYDGSNFNGIAYKNATSGYVVVGTDVDLKFDSIGVGTAASGTTGEIRATNNITAYYSDARLKDFEGVIPNALDKLSAINGYYFKENDKAKELGYNNPNRQVGVSAQEILEILPEAVTEAPIDKQYLAVQYDKLVPLLIEAIKELKQEIEELKK